MKYLVISDTHGKIEKVGKILEAYPDVDMVIHLGDFFQDSERIQDKYGIDVLGVKGNMDGAASRQSNHAEDILVTEWGNILLTHGHLYGAKRDYNQMMYGALEKECKGVFFGHSHRPLLDELEDGFVFMNPGSLSYPRGGSKSGFAIVVSDENNLAIEMCEYDEVALTKLASDSGDIGKAETDRSKTNANKKAPAGRLRGMLNYSDRF